jgi:hypothetical protein
MGYLPRPTDEQVLLFTTLSICFLAFVAILGIVTLRAVWRSAVTRGVGVWR